MNTEKQLTAVEWFADELLKSSPYTVEEFHDIYVKALAMERDQIISAHESASLDVGFENSARDWAEDYYKLKFKTK